jgi:DNA invertase Pin-like site-specific DNA recombinase
MPLKAAETTPGDIMLVTRLDRLARLTVRPLLDDGSVRSYQRSKMPVFLTVL